MDAELKEKEMKDQRKKNMTVLFQKQLQMQIDSQKKWKQQRNMMQHQLMAMMKQQQMQLFGYV